VHISEHVVEKVVVIALVVCSDAFNPVRLQPGPDGLRDLGVRLGLSKLHHDERDFGRIGVILLEAPETLLYLDGGASGDGLVGSWRGPILV
jgi:hypothetical protein